MDIFDQAIDEEFEFQDWYGDRAKKAGIDPDPYDPRHKYDYRSAFLAGAEPKIADDGLYHWPSEFKADDHPNRFVEGIDTKQPAGEYDIFDSVLEEELGPSPKKKEKLGLLDMPVLGMPAIKAVWQTAYDLGITKTSPERGAGAIGEGVKETVRQPVTAVIASAEAAERAVQKRREEKKPIDLYQSLTPTEKGLIGPIISDAETEKGSRLTEGEIGGLVQSFGEKRHEEYLDTLRSSREFVQEKLKADPEYFRSTGFLEDVLRMGPQMGAQVLAAAATGPAGGMVFMGALIAGAKYEHLTSKGMNPDRAVAFGWLDAMGQAPMEAFGLSKVMKLWKLRKSVFEGIKNLGGAMVAEWATETGQAIPELLTEIFAENPDKGVLEKWSMFLKGAPKALKQGAYEGLVVLPYTLFLGAGGVMKGADMDRWEKSMLSYLGEDANEEWARIRALPETEMSKEEKYDWLQNEANNAKKGEAEPELTPEKLKSMYEAGEVTDTDLEMIRENLKDYPDVVNMIDGILVGKGEVEEKTTAQTNQEMIDQEFEEVFDEEIEKEPEIKPEIVAEEYKKKPEPLEKRPARVVGELDEEAQRREIERIEKGVSPEEIRARAEETIEAARKQKEAEGIAQREKVADAKERLREIAKGNLLVSLKERQLLEAIVKKPGEKPVERPKEKELKRVGAWVEPEIPPEPVIVEKIPPEPFVEEKPKEKPVAKFDGWQEGAEEGQEYPQYTIISGEGKDRTLNATDLEKLGIDIPETTDFKTWKKTEDINLENLINKIEAGETLTDEEAVLKNRNFYTIEEEIEKRKAEKVPEVVEEKAPIKEPWEMTLDEYTKSEVERLEGKYVAKEVINTHRIATLRAIRDGKAVPEHVMADYPDLKPKPERRVDIEKRKRIDELTPEEMRKELMTDFLTGLGNKRALHEAKPKPVMSSIDMDSLGYVNDTYGHDAGDAALKLMGDALKNTDAVRDTYHISGDEFVIQGETEQEVDAAVQRAYEYLEKNPLEVEHEDGSVDVIPISFSYGKGETYETADKRLLVHKKAREARGERSPTKVEPPGVFKKPARRVEAEDRGEGVPEAEEIKEAKPKKMTDAEWFSQGILAMSNQKGAAEKNVAKLIIKLGINYEVMQGDEYNKRIKNEPYIDLIIERHMGPDGRIPRLYLTHYIKEGGDLIIDSEMVFHVGGGYLKLIETAGRGPMGEFRGLDRGFGKIFSTNLIKQGFGEVKEKPAVEKFEGKKTVGYSFKKEYEKESREKIERLSYIGELLDRTERGNWIDIVYEKISDGIEISDIRPVEKEKAEPKKKAIGINLEGLEVFEDKDGNRYFVRGGVRVSASRPILSTGQKAEPKTPVDLYKAPLHHEFLTKEEISEFSKRKNLPSFYPEEPEVPEFKTYEEAQEYVERKAKEFGGKNKFYASDEWKKAYPEINRLYEEWSKRKRKIIIEYKEDLDGFALRHENDIGGNPAYVPSSTGVFGGILTRETYEDAQKYAEDAGLEVIKKPETVREDPRTAATGIITGGKVDHIEGKGYEIGWADDIGAIKAKSDLYYDLAGMIAGDNADNFVDAGLSIRPVGKEAEPEAIEEAVEDIAEETTGLPGSSDKVALWVQDKLKNNKSFTWQMLFRKSEKAFGGTQAEGAFTPKDAYDAMELGINRFIMKDIDFRKSPENMVEYLKSILERIPTQTKRTKEMDEFQQFSTPPTLAYVANYAANVNKDDVYLEPSAGVGGIAMFGRMSNADKVYVNELSPRRAELLGFFGFDRIFKEDAEQLNNILPKDVKPTVIVMNPPFSATGGRLARTATKHGARHIEQALARLEDDGRLVAIVGEGMADDAPAFREWWKKIKDKYVVRANIGISGEEYRKYGTTFDNQLLVIDKIKVDKDVKKDYTIIKGKVDKIEGLLPLIEGVRDERTHPRERELAEPEGERVVKEGEVRPEPRPAVLPPIDEVGIGERPGRPAVPPVAGKPGKPTVRVEPERGDEVVGGERPGRPVEPDRPELEKPPERGGRPVGEPPLKPISEAPGVPDSERPPSELQIEAIRKEAAGELTEDLYEGYEPERIKIAGAKKHPTKLVQSAAMASVNPPKPTYKPSIPQKAIDSGKMSDIQLEAVVYAGQSNEQVLPNGERKGYFIGDGTGVGKGREIAAIIWDNWNKGRKKAVWISEKRDLYKDAKRDTEGVGWNPDLIFDQGKIKSGIEVSAKDGILFTSYDTMKSQPKEEGALSRLDQIVNWLGEDFDGVIAFDESHNMGNAIEVRGERGRKKPSQKAITGLELQRRLPNARIIYVSATGATEVLNLAYANRLGLWGEETPFANTEDFVNQISEGGVAGMELVSQNMKAMGIYTARSLSYDDVEYDRLEHKLSKEQRMTYDKLAEAWQIVLQNINEALQVTDANAAPRARMAVMSAFWGGHQRFFNQIITSMQTPAMMNDIKKQLKRDASVVIQLVNTLEASQERAIAKLSEEDTLEDLDLTPRDIIMQLVQNGFPVIQYEEYTDENGNTQSRPVTDTAGDFVENAEAVEMRERLLSELGSIRVPDSPIDMIINEFGVDMVAEVTGRKRRIIEKETERGIERAIDKRSKAKANADAAAFMNDKKRILIFSEAGGTGRSYHADLDEKNQKQRVHYLLQAGWRADRAVQGLGRTHRSNQKQAPKYFLVTTDIKGQKRFISSIARRLDQLGALTKGQRETGSQGIFQARDNLESDYAKDALYQFYRDLYYGEVQSVTIGEFERQTGLKLTTDQGNLKSDLPPATTFMNRLLSMNLDLMDKVFDEFSYRMDKVIEAHVEAGTLDMGVETIKGDKVEKISEKVVHEDEKSGAKTKYVQIDVTIPAPLYQWEEASSYSEKFFRNIRSGKIWGGYSRVTTNRQTGALEDTYVVKSPTYGYQVITKETIIDPDKWVELDKKTAQKEWQATIDAAPKTITDRKHLVTGALLPVWNRLLGHPRIMRMQTDAGERFIGRLIHPAHLDRTLQNLGAVADKIELSPAEIQEQVLNRNYKIELANGWKIERRRVSGEDRIELKGPYFVDDANLKKHGVFTERINWDTRYFIPVSEEGIGAIEYLVKVAPVVSATPPAKAREDVTVFGEELSLKVKKISLQERVDITEGKQDTVPESQGREFKRKVLAALFRKYGFETPNAFRLLKPETKEQKEIKKVMQRLGTRIVFYETIDEDMNSIGGVVMGVDPGLLYINVDPGVDPLMEVAGHEFLHSLKKQQPDLYKFLRDELKKSIASHFKLFTVGMEQDRVRKLPNYEPLTEEAAFEEYIADYVGSQFVNPEFWKMLRDSDPTLTQRLIYFLQDLLDMFKAAMADTDVSTKYFENINKAQETLAIVIKEYENSTKPEIKKQEGYFLSVKRPRISPVAQRFIDQVRERDATPVSEKAKRDISEDEKGALDFVGKVWANRKKGWKERKEDTTILDRIFSIPLHHFYKVPALKRMFEDGLKRSDDYYETFRDIDQTVEGESSIAMLRSFQKERKEEYAKLQKYLVYRDQNQIGYRVWRSKKTNTWYVFDPNGDARAQFKTEKDALDASIAFEASDYKKAGASDQAVESLMASRRITHNGFDILVKGLRDVIAKYEKARIPLPEIAVMKEGQSVKVDLKEALIEMGDMRGYYMPRIRKSGRFELRATKKNTNPILEFYDTKARMAVRQTALENKGYRVTKDLSPKMPEDVFQMAGEIVAMQAVINKALDRVTVEAGEKIDAETLEELKKVIPDVELMFAKALAEQVATVIKSRGHRAHMIKRSQVKGKDVWIGYEEDPIQSLAKYARGVAAGEAKKTMAFNLVRHFTGTDFSWQDYKDQQVELGEEAKYEDYIQFVRARRVDPVKQPNAFKEGKTYMEDMLRNEEFIDRAIGTLKGLAVMKYLAGRVSAPLVNLTALATSVPAAMNGYADISLSNAFKLVGQASSRYKTYKWGDKSVLSPWERKAFQDLEDKGWNKAQYNREALSVLRSKVGRGWDTLMDWSMFAFGATEQLNRISTIMGTYIGVKENHKGKWTEENHKEALELGKKVSDKAHAVYGKVNRPHFARGSNVAAQIAQAFYVFRTFSHNYLLTMYDLGFRQKQIKPTLFMALSPAILSGVGASVLTPAIVKVLQALGIGGDDPEEDLYAWLENNIAESADDWARFGVFGLGGNGVSLKGSLQIGVTDIPTTIPELLGAPGSIVKEVFYEGPSLMARGDIWKGTEKMLPLALSGPMKAYRESTEGVTTRTNAPIFYGDEQLKANHIDALYKTLAFNPARMAGIREKQWKERKVSFKYQDMRSDIYSKLKRFYLSPPSDRSKDKLIDIIREIEEYNARVKKRGLSDVVPLITNKSIKTSMSRQFKPSKVERARAGIEPPRKSVFKSPFGKTLTLRGTYNILNQ